MSPPASRSAMMPDPTTAASKKNVPNISATTRLVNGGRIRGSDRCWRATGRRRFSFQRFSVADAVLDLRAALTRCGFGKIVFQHHEYFPLVAVRIADPRLILKGVTAIGLHLVAS